MTDDITGIKLASYISGECSPEEEAEVRAWIAADPTRSDLVDSLRRAWELTDRRETAWDVDSAWAGLVAARATAKARQGTSRFAGRRAGGVAARWALRAAAAVILVVGGAALWRQVETVRPAGDYVVVREFVTGHAERQEVRFPDGTRVVLSPLSRLRVDEGYGSHAREVRLEGQGLFEVQHDASRPFRVRSRGLVTEVLGTRFVVRAYDDDAAVALQEGAVELRPTDASAGGALRLVPGQVARSRADGGVEVADGALLDEYFAWVDGRLVFHDTPLGEAVHEIARWYDLDIRLTDPALVDRRLTATFAGESATQILELIALSLDLRYTRAGSRVEISAR